MNNESIGEVYQNIPMWDNGTWTKITFSSREEFALLLESDYFKEPGEYEFDKSVFEWNKQAQRFTADGNYCDFLEGSGDFIRYWDNEKYNCRKGVIFVSGNKKYYLSRYYYMWINFMQFKHKLTKKVSFPDINDAQYHMQLYEIIAELKYLHGIILKKRQFGSSLFHAARLINRIWFEKFPVLKIGSSLSTYVTGDNGTWKMLQTYRNFLNDHTAWYRPMNPGGIGGWAQKIDATIGGRLTQRGKKGVLTAHSFQQSDTEGVGGDCDEFFYEEAGIAPTMDKTYEFMRPALQAGEITTGFFIGAGTVGDLSQCGPLKHYIYNAGKNGFYEVTNRWMDDKGTVGKTGLFIPEQWAMPPYIDEFGNSLVEKAVEALAETKKQWKKDLDPETYQIRCSQRPSTMEEAFDFRGESIFPLQLVKGNERAIDEGAYPYTCYKLAFDINGDVVANITNKTPIATFPVEKGAVDKTGVLVVYEPPDEEIKFCSSYYASVDPVAEGKTVTSDSLCAIYVYKNPVVVREYQKDGSVKTRVDGDKIVATWCGRYDDINKTHEQLELIIQWYQAWTIVENNIPLFIQHMQYVKKQKYLVPSSQFVFGKEVQGSKTQFQQYGWRNVSTVFKSIMLSYFIEFMKEIIDEEVDEHGNVIKPIYGITRIPDKMVHKEMYSYETGVNVDRLVALAALITFVKIQETYRRVLEKDEHIDESHLDKSEKIRKLSNSPFKNIGGGGSVAISKSKARNPFKNFK